MKMELIMQHLKGEKKNPLHVDYRLYSVMDGKHYVIVALYGKNNDGEEVVSTWYYDNRPEAYKVYGLLTK